MSTAAVRNARRALAVVMLVVAGSVVWLLRGRAGPSAGPDPEVRPTTPPSQSVMQDLVHRAFVEGREDFELRAERMSEREQGRIQLEGVTLRFPHVSRGEPGTATVSSLECLYVPGQQQAYFKGDVRMRTEDGFELETDVLSWRGAEGRAQTGRPVAFRRGALSGTATGMSYASSEARLVLPSDVALRIDREGQPPIDITSAAAVLDESEGELVFSDDVHLTQAGDELRAGQLTLYGWRGGIDRARAVQEVELSLAAGQGAGPGGSSVDRSGPRRLRSQQLDLDFREDQSLRHAAASGPGELVLLPGPDEPQERRTIRAQVLIFLWDEQGRLVELQTQRRQQLATQVLIESLDDPTRAPRTLECYNLVVRFEPETGGIRDAELYREIEFRRGGQRAAAQEARYDGARGVLTLFDQPGLEDLDQRSRLVARQIDVHAGSRDVEARHDVRHTLERGLRGAGGGIVGGEGEPVVFTARLFEWDAAGRTATYHGLDEEPALLRSGRDEIQATSILVHDEPGAATLEARGGVVSLLHTRPAAAGEAPTAIDARADQMRYEETARRIAYRGGVQLRQGEILTRSPEAVLTLVAGGGRIEKLVAGEPVEITEGDRRVNGARAVYRPATETIVVEGERVVFRDSSRQIEGRLLEFSVAGETLEVGSQQQARTETVFLGPQRRP